MNAIPTTLNHLRFRSRLEAQWSKFFDLLRWPWEYEPFDLDGYIPDFVLKFHKPLLVEVKPCIYIDDLHRFSAKIDKSGWDHEAMIVGATLFDRGEFGLRIGILKEINEDPKFREAGFPYDDLCCWSGAVLSECHTCKSLTIKHEDWSYNCRVCGVNEGDNRGILFSRAVAIWNQAKSATQWKGAK